MTVYNNNQEFGMQGPFEADTIESAADGMMEMFELWADEKIDAGYVESEDRAEYIADLRSRFIAGLEII